MYERISDERTKYLKAAKKKKRIVVACRFSLLVILVVLWQVASELKWIDSFIMSSPKQILASIKNLYDGGALFYHIGVTLAETVAGFLIGFCLGTLAAVAMWWFPIFSKITEPYIVVLNAMPKVALGPVIIVWAGAGMKSIIIMTLAISVVTTVIGVYAGFMSVDEEKIMLLKTFGANKKQILFKVLLPASYESIISAVKINIGLSWVGVIMGEFLVSKAGIGYLIMYGSQVFDLTLVMSGILLISLLAAGMYVLISALETRIKKRFE